MGVSLSGTGWLILCVLAACAVIALSVVITSRGRLVRGISGGLWLLSMALIAVVAGGALVGASSLAAAVPVFNGPTISNSSSNAGLGCDEMYLRSLNATTPVFVCAQTKRPDEGGGQRQVAVFTSDGIIGVYDLGAAGYEECFGARVWASRFSGTAKVVANCKTERYGNGNDRVPIYFDTGIAAEPLR